MKYIVAITTIVALIIIAIVVSLRSQQTPVATAGGTQTQQTTREVIWRGYILAVVVDFVNRTSRTDYYFSFENATHVPLDLSNATIRLKEPLANYIGKPIAVYVRGIYDGKKLKALEVYD